MRGQRKKDIFFYYQCLFVWFGSYAKWFRVVGFMLNEADTRLKLIDPKLHESDWKEEAILQFWAVGSDFLFLVQLFFS